VKISDRQRQVVWRESTTRHAAGGRILPARRHSEVRVAAARGTAV